MVKAIPEVSFTVLENGSIVSPKGFVAAGIHGGLKRKRKDLGIILSEKPAASAAVYTTNTFQAAPLQVTKMALEKNKQLRAMIVNSGNANAYTGEKGFEDALLMQKWTAEQFQLDQMEVAVASTGGIGEFLPMEKLQQGIAQLPDAVENNGKAFAEAILTTDTFEKSVAVELTIDGVKVVIGGVAKGSGMIHPNMATMLSFITSDVNIEQAFLQRLLKEATNSTFNMITVDGDTSTNDMVVVMANGLAANQQIDENHPDWQLFYYGLQHVAQELAKMIARDGEGATKLVTVKVEGAQDKKMAQVIAKQIVGSNLVKTAIYGADGNWGRIIMAIGNSGYTIEPYQIDIAIGEVLILKNGRPQPYLEEEVTAILKQEEVVIKVHLHQGEETATAWGCDLTYDYVRINASYRS